MKVIATVTAPDGRAVVLTDTGWEHIIRPGGHPELADLQREVLQAVTNPDSTVPGNRPDQEWFYRAAGPSRWLRVVVAFEAGNGRIVTAFPRRSLP